MQATSTIPRFAALGPLGHLGEFRSSRIDFLLRVARAQPDLSRVRLGVFDVVLLSSPELAHSLLVEQADRVRKSFGLAVFAAPLLGDGLLRLEAHSHKRRRRMLAPAFMPKRISAYAGEMVQRARVSTQRMLDQGELDVAEEAMRVTLEIVGKTLFDAEVGADAEHVGDALSDAMSCMMSSLTSVVPLPPSIPSPTNLRLHRAVRRLDQVVYRMIRERRATDNAHGDLLSILIAARDEDDGSALNDRDVRDEAMTLFLAGHETTANTLAWTLYLLGKNPDARERLEREVDAFGGQPLTAADLPRLPFCLQVIKEAMRLLPPVYMLGRRPLADITLGGQRVAKDTTVLINIIGMHRRPDVFADPERFDPDRWTPEREKLLPRQAFMPFGGGPRICIGNHFAWMETQLVLATWLQRARFELVDAEALPQYEPLITLRPRGGIQMRVRARLEQPQASPYAAPNPCPSAPNK
ncbi:MAG TPA: cytochrome P450 [Polyangiales bacterium]|nr:cytochrome P450 [Polyangiales bacterium]